MCKRYASPTAGWGRLKPRQQKTGKPRSAGVPGHFLAMVPPRITFLSSAIPRTLWRCSRRACRPLRRSGAADEWHLLTFDLKSLLAAIPWGLRVARVEAISFCWQPQRYVARCEPAAQLVAASRRRRSWLAALSGRWAGGDHRAVKRRIREWLRLTCCGRMLDAGCGTGELANLARGITWGSTPTQRPLPELVAVTAATRESGSSSPTRR